MRDKPQVIITYLILVTLVALTIWAAVRALNQPARALHHRDPLLYAIDTYDRVKTARKIEREVGQ